MSSIDDLYHDALLAELDSPRHQGPLQDFTARNQEYSASCGDLIEVWLKLDEGQDPKIEDIGWRGNGCAISQASMSLLSDRVMGQTKSEVLELGSRDLEKLIGVKKISPGRIKCLMIGLTAIQSAFTKKES